MKERLVKIMYINNISIVYYLLIGLLGLAIGKITAWANNIYVEEETPNLIKFWKCNIL